MEFDDPIQQRNRVLENLAWLRKKNRISEESEKDFLKNIGLIDPEYRDSLFALFADMPIAQLEEIVQKERDDFNHFCKIFGRKASKPQQNQGGGRKWKKR